MPDASAVRISSGGLPVLNTRMLDRRLGIAAAVLLCAIEGRQQGG
jgi:hypothetical protein